MLVVGSLVLGVKKNLMTYSFLIQRSNTTEFDFDFHSFVFEKIKTRCVLMGETIAITAHLNFRSCAYSIMDYYILREMQLQNQRGHCMFADRHELEVAIYKFLIQNIISKRIGRLGVIPFV